MQESRFIRYNAFMTGNGHRITTFAILMAATGSLPASLLALLGSVFPDRVEKFLWGPPNRHHRRTSHWFVLYLSGFCLCFYLWGDATLPTLQLLPESLADCFWPAVFSCVAFWFLGGLLHILGDAFCGKVPLFNPFKKTFGWKFFRMSKAHGEMSRDEAIFVGFVALSCLCAWLRRYGLVGAI